MLEIPLIIAFIGSLTAGVLDLKSTEFPEDIPYLMVVLGIFIWYIYAVTFGDFTPLFTSLVLGGFLAFIGWIAYKAGAWGDGDAAILAALFFLIPSLSFLVNYISNLLIVAIIYLIAYSLIIGFRKIPVDEFLSDLKKRWYFLAAVFISLPFIIVFSYYNPEFMRPLILLWLSGLGMLIFTIYAKKIEKNVFKRKIPAKDLKAGDVLASSKEWVGLTEEQVEKIKHQNKQIEIKEGVRFTIVFPITIALTAFLGNILILLII
ncbi:MAG: hypothetical protein HY831_00475 [Candidatus Aenigmarchaeota archaeon]|nr:hypothetical protein [Candidatus Aenigmarchaeota archaeon]